jgi:hypothetical protein
MNLALIDGRVILEFCALSYAICSMADQSGRGGMYWKGCSIRKQAG